MLGWEGSLSLLTGRDKFGDGLISGRDEDAILQRNGMRMERRVVDGPKMEKSEVSRVVWWVGGWRCSSKKQKWTMVCGWLEQLVQKGWDHSRVDPN